LACWGFASCWPSAPCGKTEKKAAAAATAVNVKVANTNNQKGTAHAVPFFVKFLRKTLLFLF
jgi:hypothetical protein